MVRVNLCWANSLTIVSIYSDVMKSDWNIWNLSENKPSACPSKRKKMEEEEEARIRAAAETQRSLEGGEGGDSAESKSSERAESGSSERAESESSERAESESANGDSRDPSRYGEKKSPYTPPSQFCPPVKSCCYIKMQDPCAPCCCETKPKLPPCPPKYGPQEPREPICGCDLCQKNPNNDKCCDRNRAFRGISLDSRYFEKA
ncbi:uncharacterized protein LOC143359171 [Halictus rubicundus]|uniref:uncharacterized protein LOC143359171 n=1 Tax=Halictus rubicundus TaxID=77578 RepID=UPI004036C06B